MFDGEFSAMWFSLLKSSLNRVQRLVFFDPCGSLYLYEIEVLHNWFPSFRTEFLVYWSSFFFQTKATSVWSLPTYLRFCLTKGFFNLLRV